MREERDQHERNAVQFKQKMKAAIAQKEHMDRLYKEKVQENEHIKADYQAKEQSMQEQYTLKESQYQQKEVEINIQKQTMTRLQE